MARNINRSKAGYNLRCKFYEPAYIKNEKLEKGARVLGIFYAKKTNERLENTFNGTTKTVDVIIELVSRDNLGVMGDNYVELPNGHILKIVDKVSINIDERNRMEHTLTLRGRAR